MKIKNNEIQDICSALNEMGDAQSDIRRRWAICLYLKPFDEAARILSREIERLIETEGKTDEGTGRKYLPFDNENLLALMECTSDIDSRLLSLDEIALYAPTTSMLTRLQPIIKECQP